MTEFENVSIDKLRSIWKTDLSDQFTDGPEAVDEEVTTRTTRTGERGAPIGRTGRARWKALMATMNWTRESVDTESMTTGTSEIESKLTITGVFGLFY